MIFEALLESWPALQVFTKAWSAALLNAVGDILAQLVVDKNDRLDLKRLGIFTFLVSAPAPASFNGATAEADGMPSSYSLSAQHCSLGRKDTVRLPEFQAGIVCRGWSS